MSDRYLLQKSTTKEGWWTLTDTEAGLVCRFKEHEFDQTQNFTFLDADAEVIRKYGTGIASLANAMYEWACANHRDIMLPCAQTAPSDRERIGDAIREHRKTAGLSVRQLAERSGVSAQNITKIENGRYNVSIDILAKILNALGKQLDIEDKI